MCGPSLFCKSAHVVDTEAFIGSRLPKAVPAPSANLERLLPKTLFAKTSGLARPGGRHSLTS